MEIPTPICTCSTKAQIEAAFDSLKEEDTGGTIYILDTNSPYEWDTEMTFMASSTENNEWVDHRPVSFVGENNSVILRVTGQTSTSEDPFIVMQAREPDRNFNVLFKDITFSVSSSSQQVLIILNKYRRIISF